MKGQVVEYEHGGKAYSFYIPGTDSADEARDHLVSIILTARVVEWQVCDVIPEHAERPDGATTQ